MDKTEEDIVSRLRVDSYVIPVALRNEAADEIERLRNELKSALAALSPFAQAWDIVSSNELAKRRSIDELGEIASREVPGAYYQIASGIMKPYR